ncbi:MAG: ParB family protein, partial [Myxococcota bacterium]
MAKRPSAGLVRNLLGAGANATPQSRLGDTTVDPVSPTMIKVQITEIEPYDLDLRIARNDRFEEIKASIRARGLDQSFGITRRPGAATYTIARGGNTRLLALKELYSETEDPTFLWQELKFIPWAGERTAVIGHLVENELRSDFTFYERARGVGLIRAELEAENGKAPSLNELGAYLSESGYKVDRATLTRMIYAVTELELVLPQALRAGLGEKNVRMIRKTVKDAEKVLVHENRKDTERNHALIYGALESTDSKEWGIDAFVSDLESKLSTELSVPVASVRLAFAGALMPEALDEVFAPDEKGEECSKNAPASPNRSKESKSSRASETPAPIKGLQGKREQHFANAV